MDWIYTIKMSLPMSVFIISVGKGKDKCMVKLYLNVSLVISCITVVLKNGVVPMLWGDLLWEAALGGISQHKIQWFSG